MGQPAHAIDSTALFDTKVLGTNIEQGSAGGVPVGTVITWPAGSNPDDAENWLECNGQSTAGYPELAAVVGGNVPNYQGMFLRGYGSQTYAGRTLKSGSLTAVQSDGVRIEFTDIKIKSGSMFLYRWSQSFKGTGANNDYTATFGNYIRKGEPVTGIEVGNLGSNEDTTRSVNRAVRYLIRALP